MINCHALVGTICLAIAGASAPVAAQAGFPVHGTPGKVPQMLQGAHHPVANGSRAQAAVQIHVGMEIVRSCQLIADRERAISVQCSSETPFVAALLSDADPEFEQTIAFTAGPGGWRPSAEFVRITAQRLVVDY